MANLLRKGEGNDKRSNSNMFPRMTYNLKFDPSEEKKRIKWKGVFQKSIK